MQLPIRVSLYTCLSLVINKHTKHVTTMLQVTNHDPDIRSIAKNSTLELMYPKSEDSRLISSAVTYGVMQPI